MKGLFSKLRALPKTDIAAGICFLITFLYMFISASFDGTISDEAFYISVPVRLMNGDGLFTDEWHLSQLSSVLIYPAVRLFTLITGGTAGIILFIRRIFCIFQLFTGVYAYKTLRKNGISAILISISFMLYSVIGLRTLSYNTLGVGLLFLLCLVAYSLFDKPSKIKMLVLGSLVAAFILCQPVGVAFYVMYFLAVIAFLFVGKKVGNVPYPLKPCSFLLTVAGILPVLAYFLFMLLRSSDISTIIGCIPGILSDPEHMEVTETLGIETFSFYRYFSDTTMAAGVIPLILAIVCIAVSVIIKKRNRALSVIITASGLMIFTTTFYIRLFCTSRTTETDDINFFFLPLAIISIALFLLAKKKNYRVFIIFCCSGFLYALFMTISSNLRLHASVNGYIISAFGTVLLASDLFRELKNESNGKKLSSTAAIFLAVSVFAAFIFNIGATSVMETLSRAHYKSTKVISGTYSGISLPSDQALLYTNIYNDAQKIKELTDGDDRLFVSENVPAMYLETGLLPGAFSEWFISEQLAFPETRERYRDYYELFPENIPDYIYVPAYVYTENGMSPLPVKMMAEFPLALFEGEAEDIGNGLLIKVTGLKDEQN